MPLNDLVAPQAIIPALKSTTKNRRCTNLRAEPPN
jgi:hypothetical protein